MKKAPGPSASRRPPVLAEAPDPQFLPRLFLALSFLLIALLSLHWICDYDFWIHLGMGREMWRSHHWLRQDIFSFTRAGRPTLQHEWLSQVLLYFLWRAGGANLLILFKTLLLLTVFLAPRLYFRRRVGPLYAGFAVLLAGLSSSFHFTPRPHLWTYLFLQLDLLILYGLDGGWPLSRAAWMLGSVQLLWVNTHAGWVLGPVLVGIYAAGALISRERKSRFEPAALLAAGLVLISLINPDGIRTLWVPFQIAGSDLYRRMILEWMSPFAATAALGHRWILWFFLAESAFVLLTLWAARRRCAAWEMLAAAAFWGLACRSIRMIPVFAFAAYPLVLANGTELEKTVGMALRGKRSLRQGLAGLCAAGAVALAFCVYSNRFYVAQGLYERTLPGVCPFQFPEGAAEFIRKEGIPGKGFNTLGMGGYLLWALPEKPVFVDGRAEIYGEDFLRLYWNAVSDPGELGKALDFFGISYVLLPAGNPLASLAVPWLHSHPDWALVYFDASALVFARRKAVSPQFLARWEIRDGRQNGAPFEPSITPFRLLPGQINYPVERLQAWLSCSQIGDLPGAVRYFEAAEAACPDLPAEIRFNAGRIYLQRGDRERAARQFDLALKQNPALAALMH